MVIKINGHYTYRCFQMDIINFDFHYIKFFVFQTYCNIFWNHLFKKQSNIWDEIKVYGGSFS